MECGQNIPSSWFNPNSSQPDFTSNYTLGSSVNLTWWGGTPYVPNPTQVWDLILAWFNDTNEESASSSGHGVDMTSTEELDFTYGYSESPSWVMIDGDTCDYTALGIAWAISPDIDISSNHKFKIFGLNMTDGDTTTVTSPGFILLPSSISSTSSSASAAASRNSSTTSQTSPNPSATHSSAASTNSATPITAASTSSPASTTNSTGLSRGAKVGIGVGCTLLASLVLLGVFVLMRRRRRQQTTYQVRSSEYSKPELDGRAAKKLIPELSGGERHELDEQHGIGEVEGRNVAPVEMPELG